MKKILFSIAALLLTVSASADVVTKTKAESVARNVLGSSSVEYVWNSLDNKNYGDAQPAFHVFNSKDGWVIVAADDCATPVLMHGKGTFDPKTMPDNMRSLLGEIEYNINTARKHKLTQTPEIRKAWVDCSVSTRAAASPVETLVQDKDGNYGTALWNQGSPYNAKCPEVTGGPGGRCYAGCVAAAMSIIMRFHQWPETGKGTIGGYSTDCNGYPVNIPVESFSIEGYEYGWANIPTTDAKTSSTWNDAQKEKVADILYHCGAMVRMDYGAGGSSASTSLVPAAMAEHMSYSSSAVERYRSSYTNQQWFNMLKAEIDADHPILYSGQNLYENSGHAFVCDGYNSNNQVHINWGWGGYLNAWFAVCYLGPVDGEGSAVYSRDDSAIFGLVPVTGTEQGGSGICFASYSSTEGLTITDGTIGKNDTFTVHVSSIKCSGPDAYTGKVNIGLIDKSGTLKEIIGKYNNSSNGFSISGLPSGYFSDNKSFSCTISSDIDFGDRICLCYTDPSGNWLTASTAYSRQSNGTQVIGSISAMNFTFLEIPSSVFTGQIIYPSLSVGQKVPSSVTWYLDGTALTADYVKMTTAGDHVFKAVITYSDDSTETIVKKVTVK